VKKKKVVISPPERRELSRRVRSRTIGAEDARRARVILALGSGLGVRAVAGMLRCSSSYVQRWRERFLASRLTGLVVRHQGRKVRRDAAKLEARILEWTRRGPQEGSTPLEQPPVGRGAGHQSQHDHFAGLGTTRPSASPIAPLHAEQ
jgi:Homeodomain-like domain-containing protein